MGSLDLPSLEMKTEFKEDNLSSGRFRAAKTVFVDIRLELHVFRTKLG